MSKSQTALLTFTIGPVHSFIALARRVADQWAGSRVLTHLIGSAIAVVESAQGCSMIFPAAPSGRSASGLPNRLVCRVPASQAAEIAKQMGAAVTDEWSNLVAKAVTVLKRELGLGPDPALWQDAPPGSRQTDRVIEVAWSFVVETGDYATDFRRGALQFAASRVFRPSEPTEETGEQCAICGERRALPDGNRDNVRRAWRDASRSAKPGLKRYVRDDQGRLCLVCMTKRLYPLIHQGEAEEARFLELQAFQPEHDDERPYVAVVAMDGDHMGRLLGRAPDALTGPDVEQFHRDVSEALTRFAGGLVLEGRAEMNLDAIGNPKCLGTKPQLIYAGGEDVLFVADPRDAIRLATAVRKRYRDAFYAMEARAGGNKEFTISAAVLIAHAKQPAGSMFRDAEELLKRKAKAAAGRDAIAIRLAKRGGTPVEVAFQWDDQMPWGNSTYGDAMTELVGMIADGSLSSGSTYRLVEDAALLRRAFAGSDGSLDFEAWQKWSAQLLSRAEVKAATAARLSELMPPLLEHGRAEAVRIARFLAVEVGS